MSNREIKTITLDIQGLGIIMYSPSAAAHIADGEDYLTAHYWVEKDVQSHIQGGSIVGFGTGSHGIFILKFFWDYPPSNVLESCEFKLRLAVKVEDAVLCIRDLYDLMDWLPSCPREQTIEIERGVYHITLCSKRPASGILGDHQSISVFLSPLPAMPALSRHGVPTLCE
jgi:hypothetical protein